MDNLGRSGSLGECHHVGLGGLVRRLLAGDAPPDPVRFPWDY
jgi:hypothetical protein